MEARDIEASLLGPDDCRHLAPALSNDAWIYRWVHKPTGWKLSVATLGEPESGKLSLGGFRIAPAERTDSPGYDNDLEALQLAIGMEAKVSRSRLVAAAGPLASEILSDIRGGKCVLQPTVDARVGQPRDTELLDFATHCLHEFERTSGVSVTTGQDLGHGLMSDGVTSSLDYLHCRFPGSITADTSKPTGEGNYRLLTGMLRALDIAPLTAVVGFVGCGNVGEHVLRRVHGGRSTVFAIESSAEKRRKLENDPGVDVMGVENKPAMIARPMDALVVNASGGTLDSETVRVLCDNPRLKIVCGCENLALPNPDDMTRLSEGGIIYAPTEIGGMMGYLTAVEQYLCQKKSVEFDIDTMIEAAKALDDAGFKVARHILNSDQPLLFDEAIDQVYS